MKIRFTSLLTLSVLLGSATLALAGGAPSKAVVPEVDSAKLWSQNCQRCHNIRPAKSYSDSQWVVIMQHMRTRANLTGPEARAILAFLQEAN